MKKTEILMNKPVVLGLSILELSKILMYGFWYDYVKPKYGEKTKSCYMDTGSFIVYIKADNIYKDIPENVETKFDTSNYELDKPFPKAKNKKFFGLMKDELGGKIMTKFVGLKAKGTKKCVIKRKLTFQNCKNCLEATQPENKINYLEKNKIYIDSIKKKS